MRHTDVLVIGGGITGLAATAALARTGVTVTCVDPAPAQPPDGPPLDGRTTALFQGSLRALAAWGAWPFVTVPTEGLWRMRIVDETPRGAAHTATFESDELPAGGPFGENVPNTELRGALLRVIGASDTARHLTGTTVANLSLANAGATATLSTGETITAELVVGADGKRSVTRDAAGIHARSWSYGQTALAFSIRHQHRHGGVSTEFHRPQGPLVQVPMPGATSSMVWVERDNAAATYTALDKPAFRRVVARHMHGVLGDVTDTGPVWTYPVSSLIADRLAGPRVALIGEAAHGLPPIGAQGLNLGIADVAVLAEELATGRRTGADIGSDAVLSRYESRRRPDVVARLIGVDALNRAVIARTPPARRVRRKAVGAVARFRPVRSLVMQAGMTPMGGLPGAMRTPTHHDPGARAPAATPAPATDGPQEDPDGRNR